MANQATADRSAVQILGLSTFDQNIHDSDFIYLDNRSLKVAPPTETNLFKIQESLRTLLCEKLNTAGRKSLTERLVKKQKALTYKELKVLTQQINNPRTKQKLLDISTHFFSTIPIESLPTLVREDIENKGMRSIPENIHLLHQAMTCNEFEMHSLPLIKYLTTQCMHIDFNTPFETLKKEYEDCAQILLTPCSNTEEILQQMDCISTLKGLKDIWTQQNPADWNQVILQCTSEPSSPRLPEHKKPNT